MPKRSRIGLALAGLVLATWNSGTAQRQRLLLGVLEDNPGIYAGDPHYWAVRVVFYRNGGQWEAYPNDCPDQNCLKSIASEYPSQTDWTIAFDGRELGHVASRAPQSFEFYSAVGQQRLIGSHAPPAVGKPSRKFGGFLEEPVYRPLIAVSQLNYRDPDLWKRIAVPKKLLAAMRKAFRNRFPKVENCTKGDIEKAVPWPYSDSNIGITATYASKRGWVLAEVLLTEYLCDGPADEPFAAQWFVVSPEGHMRLLDSNMWLVDAGDYDNDGKSELVFSIDDYNRGGYKLFYDDFRQRAVFEFSYH